MQKTGFHDMSHEETVCASDDRAPTLSDPAEDVVFRNLIAALNRLREDMDRVELWTAALTHFQTPPPEYQSSDQYILPSRDRGVRR
jgi:hypothetical protein